jgi:sulfide:quinone oxidoreductase
MTRTLVLGAGFGGIATALGLRRRLGSDHEVLLVDRDEHFLMGLRKLWALVGLGSLSEGRRPRTALEASGIRFLQREIRSVDPTARSVETDQGTVEADRLVVALGARTRPDMVPGLSEHAHDLYDAAAIPELAAALADFDGGEIAIVVAGAPYKCPPAPYEFAMLLDAHLRQRGRRDRTRVTVTTLQPILLPNAGPAGSAWLADRLAERGIDATVGRSVERVEAGRVLFESGTSAEADLVIAVPPHRPPAVVADSGLALTGPWVQVDPGTLATSHDGVYAVGDVTTIPLANGLPLPKAGLFAELQGERVAAAIAAEVRGGEPPPPFDGRGYCFVEMGGDRATRVQGDFFARPEPVIGLGETSAAVASEKRAFEAERLRAWFGG